MTNLKFTPTEITAKHRKFLNRALELSKTSTMRDFKHGAIIVKNGKTVATGVNANLNDPRLFAGNVPVSRGRLGKGISIHAEIAAMSSVRKMDLEGATIYIARSALSDGAPLMSKPCENCQKFLKKAGIKKVYYTIDSSMEL